jgi:hypothetical protein
VYIKTRTAKAKLKKSLKVFKENDEELNEEPKTLIENKKTLESKKQTPEIILVEESIGDSPELLDKEESERIDETDADLIKKKVIP